VPDSKLTSINPEIVAKPGVCRGVFKGTRGLRDLNEGEPAYLSLTARRIIVGNWNISRLTGRTTELIDPLKKQIAKAWESVCTRHIPDKLKDLVSELVEHLGTFIASVKQRKALQQSKSYGLVLDKLVTFERSLQETAPLINRVMEGQKEANRVLTPAISRAMFRAYTQCRTEAGKCCRLPPCC
jgi:hypothetical protein